MAAVVWGDFCCPWCYVGQARSALLRSLGVEVTSLPYQLHPAVPFEGRPLTLRAGGRIEAVYRQLAAACADEGLPFSQPTRLPDTRLALETAEVVRALIPDAAEPFHREAFATHFVVNANLADRGVLAATLERAGATPREVAHVEEAVLDGAGRDGVTTARELALDLGIAGVPAWQVDGRLVIPGLQDPPFFERMVARLRERPA